MDCFEVKLTTKSYGKENSWTLGACSSDGTYDVKQEYVQTCCLAPGAYKLECKDSHGDGWHGGFIDVNGTRYCEGFSKGRVNTSQLIFGGTKPISNKYILITNIT